MSLSISTQESQLQHGSPRRPTTVGHRGLKKSRGKAGTGSPSGRSAKKARKTGEKPLPHRHRHKVRNSMNRASRTSTTFQMYCNCEISMVWAIDLHSFLYLNHRAPVFDNSGHVNNLSCGLWNVDCLLHDLHQELGKLVKITTCTCGTCTTCTTKTSATLSMSCNSGISMVI